MKKIKMNADGGKTFEQGCEVKAAAEQLFNELGLEITAAAIAEGRRIMRDKNTKGCHNMDELKAELKE